MADNRLKLAQGLRNLPAAAREDLAGRAADIERGKTVELLRRAGKEMYENPIVNTAIGFTPVLGDVQAAGETMAALGRGAPWQETAGYAAGMLPFVPMIGKTVWHGSPHTFDKFDLSKIGTGEGAQAYGHGLYLADEKPTALKYAKGDAPITFTLKETGEEIAPNHPMYNDLSDTYERMAKNGYIDNFLEQVEPKNSALYKVDLPDEQIAKMLDWDKPLSEQPEIQQAFVNHLVENQRLSPERASDFLKDKTAGEAYGTLSGRNNQEIISQSLLERGIPGIQYLDQASRGAGEGTRNYVVFSDEIPQILERNGQPIAQALRDYRGAHTAPGPDFGAQLHDVTGGGAMYPEDIYSSRGASIYGHGGSDIGMDKETMRIIQQMRNKPEEMVDIYRAVPNETDISTINPGDWVTINPNYAKQHGESNLPEGYKILQQKVPAKSVWTNADSIHEYGYWPE